ncbi:TonB-dependent receptor plug domain-containing protein [Sphingomonas glaciei]|uniref:Outer membrane beta-barrel protein n=1 Tax=Sphingomonas glaciei TaxID=2938948 RepID=A0ABY5MXP5_9SPHN|nr:TonB-dependent receptor [Sphingomonas glaciei]UUR08902.1 outer membrane beta-barrel protein [Sphingomonas glaciei]
MKLVRASAFAGVSLLSLTAVPAMAQSERAPATPIESVAAGDTAEDEQLRTAQEIVVQANIGYRNRSEAAEPVLVYDTDYFQRFEPLTIGDALKRVPSVTFLSDVLESDGARLRGLDPGYTQILVNGERVPGANVDRSFFLDRIPAELVDRVEIVRANSARRTGDAVAGTLNIVLRDAFKFDGGYARVGGLLFDDGKVKPNVGAVFGSPVGPGRLLIGGNIQGRYNPKQKSSLRFSDSPENNPSFRTEDFDNREDQSDTRDGTDYNVNASYGLDLGATRAELSGFYVHTDRTETERSFEYDDPTARTGPVRTPVNGNLLTDNANVNSINQDSYSLAAKLAQDWSAGTTTARFGAARFQQDSRETEFEIDFDRAPPRFTGDLTLTDIDDREFSLGLDHKLPIGGGVNVVFGGYAQDKRRDTDIATDRNRFNLAAATRVYDQFTQSPDAFVTPFDPLLAVAGGLNRIDENRRDLFALVEGRTGALRWEAGVRRESTDVKIVDLDSGQRFDNDFDLWLPSASMKFDLTGRDRLTASVARTNRRPNFNFITPALLEAELGDNDLLGNPLLKPETAWGVDAGYERRIGRTGVAGVNVFYRRVKNLVEVANTGNEGSEGEGTFVLQPQNSGSGKAWGIEFDLSASLAAIGLSDTGIFGNLSLLDSSIRDFAGKRRFNGQSKYVYNFGFIQNLRRLDAAFGATFRKQGPAVDRIVGEEIRTTYGADLEVFVEKRLFEKLTIRAVGSNLLNGKKKEVFNKFTTIEDQANRDFDEYELEAEEAGPVFQLVARYAF